MRFSRPHRAPPSRCAGGGALAGGLSRFVGGLPSFYRCVETPVARKLWHLGEALASIGRSTGDPMRDLPPATRIAMRAKPAGMPHAESLLAAFEAEAGRDQGALDRIFGEALPSGWC